MIFIEDGFNPLYPFHCSNCDIKFTAEEEESYIFCPYCGERALHQGKAEVGKEEEFFEFIAYCEVNGTRYELFQDDYGQSYFIIYKSVKGDVCEVCCGTYCDYEDALNYLIEKEEFRKGSSIK